MKVAEEVERQCVWCKVKKGKMQEQRMGNVPEDRLEMGSAPFTWVSLDLMGPVLVKSMVKSRASMKVWPLLLVCRSTGALHTQLMHNYGTEAFLLQWENFVAIRGTPMKVVSDQGSQLTSADNYVRWEEKESPKGWEWEKIQAKAARGGTEWVFVPAGCQWRNGLAESRVKALKSTLAHIMVSSLIGIKPTLSYAELSVVLARAASIVNDRPIGVRALTEEDIVPITPNQLLLGRTSTRSREVEEEDLSENGGRSGRYQEELLTTWWKLWRVQVFPHLVPYPSYKAAKRSSNLKVGDVCLLSYAGKIRGTFKLCRVIKVWEDEGGVVRTVEVKFKTKGKETMEELKVGVQRLVLIQTVEDLEDVIKVNASD